MIHLVTNHNQHKASSYSAIMRAVSADVTLARTQHSRRCDSQRDGRHVARSLLFDSVIGQSRHSWSHLSALRCCPRSAIVVAYIAIDANVNMLDSCCRDVSNMVSHRRLYVKWYLPFQEGPCFMLAALVYCQPQGLAVYTPEKDQKDQK